MEPVRPAVDRFVLELIAERTFARTDFVERSDGSVRLAPRLVQELADTMPMWARLVAPYAETVAHLLGRAVRGQWTPRTRSPARSCALHRRRSKLGDSRRRSLPAVRSRRNIRPAVSIPRRPRSGSLPALTAALRSAVHGICAASSVGRLGLAKHARRVGVVARRLPPPMAACASGEPTIPKRQRAPPEAFAPIRDGLAGVKLTEIMAATGLAKSTASQLCSGRTVPHVRHWPALATLAGVSLPSLDEVAGQRV
jgi:hypothetical protein